MEMILVVPLLGWGAILLLPVAVFSLECLASLVPARRKSPPEEHAHKPRVAVLIPAHNEELVIGKTLAGLVPTLGPNDRAVVVADNCRDNTAEIARRAGAVVVERDDAVRRGKGYALDCGVRSLEADPPDVVVVIDADCDVEPRTVPTVAQLVYESGQPAQTLNLGEFDPEADSVYVVSALANRFTNLVRPLGVQRMGLPYRLMGTGMAVPWSILKTASLAGGNLVEDTRLGVDLAIEGYTPLFCPEVRVTSRLPQQSGAFRSQKTRWEHGHMQAALEQVPRLVRAAVSQRRPKLLWMALDLCVPPLALLCLLWLAGALVSAAVWALSGAAAPLRLFLFEGALLALCVGCGWAVHCRREIPWTALTAVPKYVWRKLPIYTSFLVRRQNEWVRTAREPINPSQPAERQMM